MLHDFTSQLGALLSAISLLIASLTGVAPPTAGGKFGTVSNPTVITTSSISVAGGVYGTGTSTQVSFWKSSTSVSSDPNLNWDNTNKVLVVGSSTIGTTTANIANAFTVVTNGVNTLAVATSTEASSTYRLVVQNIATTTNLTASNTVLFAVGSSGISYITGSSTVAIGGSSLAAGACTSTATIVNYPLSTSTDVVSVSPQTYPGAGLPWNGYISATGNATSSVTVQVCAEVIATPVASAYNFTVMRANYSATTTSPRVIIN